MKLFRWLIVLLSLVYGRVATAQPYGNEWIDYSKTHYKFRIWQDGLCRIPYATLQGAGINVSDLVGANFKLYRQGEEVTVFVTTNGSFSSADYIEFWGLKNDGKPDNKLFRDPDDQLHPYYSFFNDTIAYFLVIDPAGDGLRYSSVTNNLLGAPEKEAYFMHLSRALYTTRYNFCGPFNAFYSITDCEYLPGEGNMDAYTIGPATTTKNVPTAKIYTGSSPSPTAKITYSFYNTNKTHDVLSRVGTKSFRDITSLRYDARRITIPLDKTDIVEGQTSVSVNPQVVGEQIALSMIEIIYARLFDFENLSNFRFGLDKNTDTYIEISNFNAGTVSTPVLYDQTNRQRIEGIVESNLVKFRFPAASNNRTDLVLASRDVSQINQINALEPKVFIDYTAPENQGNYVIISNKRLAVPVDGINYLEAYRDYRASDEGGGWNAKLVYIDELEDQFGLGIKYGSFAISHFARYGADQFTQPLEQLFIVGKAFAPLFVRINATQREQLMVQSFGLPATDNLLVSRSANDPRMVCGVGRLSVTQGSQIRDYLDKIKAVEANYNDTSSMAQTIDNKAWQKQVLHLAGGNSDEEQEVFRAYMENYENIIEGPSYGGNVSLLSKNITDPIQIAQNVFIDSVVRNGLSLITFFGHSATSSIDFNILPGDMDNEGKYPVMLSNGCFVGNIFEAAYSLSEDFVLRPNKATIAYIAPQSYAVAPSLNSISNRFYNNLSVDYYAQPIGTALRYAFEPFLDAPNELTKILAQQMIFHGDPGIRLSRYSLPDYAIDDKSVFFTPEVINLGRDSFDLNLVVHNLGKAVDGEYTVSVERKFPNGEIDLITKIAAVPHFKDTVIIRMPTNKLIGAGINNFRIKVDYEEEYNELSEFNNEISIDKPIFDDDIVPLTPDEFSIVNSPADFVLNFSTVNPFSAQRSYILQIDTTENFNSPLKQELTLVQSGGVVTWQPTISKLNNTVYYYRSSLDTLYGNPLSWNNSSFLYNTSLSPGWNQSHYFQYLKDDFNTIKLPESRNFTYAEDLRTIQLVNGNFSVIAAANISFSFDGFVLARNSFTRNGFLFFVYDVNKAKALETYNTGAGFGPYNDEARFTTPGVTLKVIQFSTNTQERRIAVMNFLENSVPDDAIVFCYSFGDPVYSQWGADSVTLGKNLFQVFEQLGAQQIRQVPSGNPYFFFGQKNNPSFTVQEAITPNNVVLDTIVTFSSRWYRGSLSSPLIGPSTSWKSFDFQLSPQENPSFDENYFKIFGLGADGLTATELYSNVTAPINTLAIDANQYPYLKLEWNSEDDSNTTPSQLDYWRIIYDQVPEAAINPLLYLFKTGDTVSLGQEYLLKTAFQNLTNMGMDSILVKFIVKNPQGATEVFYQRFAPLPGDDSIHISFKYTFDDPATQGLNTIIVEANPDNDQPEQYHPNNIGVVNVFVLKDVINPLLDVTFDGRHIVDGDIVSPKPEIRIKLKDENKYLGLSDTSSFQIFLIDPLDPANPQRISLTDPRVEFIPADPAQLNTKNEAVVIFRPEFTLDGTYQLRVQGADRSSNDAGDYDYRISFDIITKPAITNVLNYPNPFSTSTQFVFTLTGTEIPQDLRIQIMTVTGKVVREITREELGPIRIGQNVTEFKWNGTDQYGDRLANGLYLYKVKAKLNGFNMDMLETSADKYFKKGYGKMYLIH